MKVPVKPVSDAALERLSTYSFPGNIRELRNVLERALILGRSANVVPEDLLLPSSDYDDSKPNDLVSSIVDRIPKQVNLRELLAHLERALIVRSLELARGVQAEAARKLGLSRSDLGYKVSRYGLSGPTEGSSVSDTPTDTSGHDHA